MVYFGVDLYRFSLICNDCFRKVVYKKEKGDEQIVLTPSISESNIKFLKISSLFPPVHYSTTASACEGQNQRSPDWCLASNPLATRQALFR